MLPRRRGDCAGAIGLVVVGPIMGEMGKGGKQVRRGRIGDRERGSCVGLCREPNAPSISQLRIARLNSVTEFGDPNQGSMRSQDDHRLGRTPPIVTHRSSPGAGSHPKLRLQFRLRVSFEGWSLCDRRDAVRVLRCDPRIDHRVVAHIELCTGSLSGESSISIARNLNTPLLRRFVPSTKRPAQL